MSPLPPFPRTPETLTETQRRIFALLADGRPHTKREIHGMLNDELAELRNVNTQVSLIRAKIRPRGLDILVQYVKKSIHFRMVQTFGSFEPPEKD